MAGDADNARVWLEGDVYVADVGTTLPTDTSAALNAGFTAVGLLSEDGLTRGRDQDVTDHKAWGRGLIRRTQSGAIRTFTFTALEDNSVVFGLVNPGSAQSTAGGVTTRTVVAPDPDPRAWVFETIDGDIVRRIAIERGEVSEVGEITDTESALSMFEITVTVYPNEDGEFYVELTDDPAAVVGS